jgi:hypothetical protein
MYIVNLIKINNEYTQWVELSVNFYVHCLSIKGPVSLPLYISNHQLLNPLQNGSFSLCTCTDLHRNGRRADSRAEFAGHRNR